MKMKTLFDSILALNTLTAKPAINNFFETTQIKPLYIWFPTISNLCLHETLWSHQASHLLHRALLFLKLYANLLYFMEYQE